MISRYRHPMAFMVLTTASMILSSLTNAEESRRFPPQSVACAPNGPFIVTVGNDELCVHDVTSLRVATRFKLPFSHTYHVRFEADDVIAVAGGSPGESGNVALLQIAIRNDSKRDGRTSYSINLLKNRSVGRDVVYATTSVNRDSIVAACHDRALYFGEMQSEKAFRMHSAAHSKPVTDVAGFPELNLLVTCGADNTVRVWNSLTGGQIRALNNHRKAVRGLALRPGQDAAALPWLATASDDRTLRFWQPTIGRMVRFKRLPSAATCVAWRSDGAVAVVGCRDGRVYSVNPDTLAMSASRPLGEKWVTCVSGIPGSHDVLVGGGDGSLVRISATP